MGELLNTYVVTGGNRGLGASIVRQLAKLPNTQVVIAARDLSASQAFAAQVGSNVSARELDLKSKESVAKFVESWDSPITGLVNNAGVQFISETPKTADGYDETFTVNHLHALKLTTGLMPYLRSGRVLFIGSGTHNPKEITARMFGFRGAQFSSVKNCAEGINRTKIGFLLGFDRYATSKFLNTVTAIELARRIDAKETAFYCLDPGLMPGTGLARSAPPWLLFMWNHILPRIAGVIPGSSHPEKSSAAAAWILTESLDRLQSGTVYDYNQSVAKNVWEKAKLPEIGKAVLDDSLSLIGLNAI